MADAKRPAKRQVADPQVKKTFKTPNSLVRKFGAYLKKCEDGETLPNIAGFLVEVDISYNDWYMLKKYIQKNFKTQEMLESAVISAKVQPGLKIFYLKNKFGYTDRAEINSRMDGELKISFNIPRPEDQNKTEDAD